MFHRSSSIKEIALKLLAFSVNHRIPLNPGRSLGVHINGRRRQMAIQKEWANDFGCADGIRII
jgi:hypothetical protein